MSVCARWVSRGSRPVWRHNSDSSSARTVVKSLHAVMAMAQTWWWCGGSKQWANREAHRKVLAPSIAGRSKAAAARPQRTRRRSVRRLVRW